MYSGINKSVLSCKLPHGVFEREIIHNTDMVTVSDLDECIDYFTQFSGTNVYYLGDGNYRNHQPIFGYGRS